ncbi:hypothetical protein IM511_06530 [Erythrobacteraceae bacterium E2-1 Yellow Sea]|nr:hypothetical protein [Erythrobacteraceae bacterium E2-1 Yellow Sea]
MVAGQLYAGAGTGYGAAVRIDARHRSGRALRCYRARASGLFPDHGPWHRRDSRPAANATSCAVCAVQHGGYRRVGLCRADSITMFCSTLCQS